jgi:hypothetical protein
MKYRKAGIKAYFRPVNTRSDSSAQDARNDENNESQHIFEMAKESISDQIVGSPASLSGSSYARYVCASKLSCSRPFSCLHNIGANLLVLITERKIST